MSHHNETNFKEAFELFLTSFRLKDKVMEARLRKVWRKIVGTMIFKHTERIHLYENKLYIYLDSAPLRNELTFAKEKLLQAINSELDEPYIKEVVLR